MGKGTEPDDSGSTFLDALRREFLGEKGQRTVQVARHPVSPVRITDWCDAMGDRNPIYLDGATARRFGHDAGVAPPAMLPTWAKTGFGTLNQDVTQKMKDRMISGGFSGWIATNCEQEFERYLRVDDRVTATTFVEDISDEKRTRLGPAHFVTYRSAVRDQDEVPVGSVLLRVMFFVPTAAVQP